MTTRWDELFDRATGHDVDIDAIRAALDRRREEAEAGPEDTGPGDGADADGVAPGDADG